MIKEVTMYTVICSNCGKDVNQDNEYSCYSTIEQAYDFAMLDCDWINPMDDRHYCPDCATYDDNDNLVIDKARTKLIS
jgi:hypothetical protein